LRAWDAIAWNVTGSANTSFDFRNPWRTATAVKTDFDGWQ